MEIIQQFFDSVFVIRPKVFRDHRGFFMPSYSKKDFLNIGLSFDFVQDNHSYSVEQGTIRALHYQRRPFAQTKLVRVIKGKIIDFVVDIRKESPTYGKFASVELSDDNNLEILVPKGFAHGICTLTNDCHVGYKVDEYFSPEHNAGILWNDPTLNIPWPVKIPILSEQDQKWPILQESIF